MIMVYQEAPNFFEVAECRKAPTGVMYPERGDEIGLAIAKNFCANCLVVDECLDWAIDNQEGLGVYGNKSEVERHTIIRKRRQNEQRPARSLRQNDR